MAKARDQAKEVSFIKNIFPTIDQEEIITVIQSCISLEEAISIIERKNEASVSSQ